MKMKKYCLLKNLPGAVAGMLVDISSERAAIELRIIPPDYPDWFEEVKEEPKAIITKKNSCRIHKDWIGANCTCDIDYSQPKKEECKHEKAELLGGVNSIITMCVTCGFQWPTPQPKELKPSETIQDRAFLIRHWSERGLKRLSLSPIEQSILSFLDEYFTNPQ